MSESPSTSLTLLQRVQASDAAAWNRLVDLYAPLVLHWCRRGGVGDADAEDVFQEVFRSVALRVADFRRDRPGDTFRGWLRTIAQNKLLDHFRRRQRQPAAAGGSDMQRQLNDIPDPILDGDDPEEDVLVTRQLRQALEGIRPEVGEKTWQAFWQVQVEAAEPREVADELGMTPAAVRKARYRVLERLRAEMGELME